MNTEIIEKGLNWMERRGLGDPDTIHVMRLFDGDPDETVESYVYRHVRDCTEAPKYLKEYFRTGR